MGNCAASKLAGGEEEVVKLCRERRKLLKAAVDGRYDLAVAHAKYAHSLCAVAAAINLFVTRHSTPTPILIALPPPSSSSDDPSFLKQTPTEPKVGAVTYRSSCSSSSSSSSCSCLGGEGRGGEVNGTMGENGELGCGFYFPGRVEAPPSPVENFGWDFFNPFDGVRAVEEAVMMAGGLGRSSDEDLRALREEEGIPELEEEEDSDEGKRVCEKGHKGGEDEGKVVALEGEGGDGNGGAEVVKLCDEGGGGGGCDNGGAIGEKGLTVVDAEGRERDLLEALRDVEDHFTRAYVSGKDVTRMLEATHIAPVCSDFREFKDNSSKLIQAITWHRSSSRSSSCRSFPASSSRSSSFAESKGDLFDDYGGMESGSHSQTLGRLYAWEKKLYEEVKAGDETRRIYQRKCSQLRNRDRKGADSRSTEKTRAAAKDLHTRIWVAIRSAETISGRIQKLRDEELQPQLLELLQGLKRMWKVMVESHDTQNQIMCEVKSFTCPPHANFCGDVHRFATLQLDAELQNWQTCFGNYVAAQRVYVEALEGWLSKFLVPEVELFSRGRRSHPLYGPGAPPLFLMCHDWLLAIGRLQEKPTSDALGSFSRDVRVLWTRQGEEQQQKRRVDGMAKELDRKVLAFQKAEKRMLQSNLSEKVDDETNVRHQVENLAGRKEMLEMLRKRLEAEKEKHHDCMLKTQKVTLSGFKMGFSNVFESITGFSKGSLKMCEDLLVYGVNARAPDGTGDQPPSIEGCQTDECRQLPDMEEHKR